LLVASADRLDEWGFTIEEFGAAVRVRTAPAGLPPEQIGAVLTEIGEHLQQGGDAEAWRSRMLTTLACHGAIRAGQALAFREMAELAAQLGRCAAPLTCPHGRPTIVALTRAQLERQFGRAG
jgi:DNA mismatch repair protein MutL